MLGNVVDTLLRLFEYIVQGILTALVLGYVLVWIHPVKDAVARSIDTITRYLLYPHWQKPVPDMAIAIILLGSAYFLGVVSNVAGYWLLEPIHHRVIRSVAAATNTSSPKYQGARPQPDASYWSAILLPLRIGERIGDFPAYQDHLREEALWGNCKLDAMENALNPLLKQSRIIRGVVVCALAFSLIAALKFVYFLCVWLLLHLKPGLGNWLYKRTVKNPLPGEPESSEGPDRFRPPPGGWLYRHNPSPDKPDSSQSTDKKKPFTDTKRALVATMIYALFATFIYLSSIAGWRTVEVEYHLTAHFGAVTCGEANASTLPAGGPAGGPHPPAATAPQRPRPLP